MIFYLKTTTTLAKRIIANFITNTLDLLNVCGCTTLTYIFKILIFFHTIISLIHFFISLIVFIFFNLFKKIKYVINYKYILNTKFITHLIFIHLCYIGLNNINLLYFTTNLHINLLIISSILLIYLIYFDRSICEKYPRVYFYIVVLCTIIVLSCLITFVIKVYFGFDIFDLLLSKFDFLKHY